MSSLRSTEQRKSDVLAVLERNGHAWLATASRSARPHLIAVSAWWNGSQIILATRKPTPTARNLDASKSARLAFGTQDDVVMIDAEVVDAVDVADADPGLDAGWEAVMGWKPADEGPDWRYYRLSPVRIEAYKGYGELEGRTVMREGRWLA